MADQTLNTEGLNCPMPIIKTKKTLKGMAAGEILAITTTDPGSVADFKAFCNLTGNSLLSSGSEGKIFSFEIKKN